MGSLKRKIHKACGGVRGLLQNCYVLYDVLRWLRPWRQVGEVQEQRWEWLGRLVTCVNFVGVLFGVEMYA